MRITDGTATTFAYKTNVGRDSHGHTHPTEEHDATETMVTVATDEGAEGYAFGGNAALIESVVKPQIVGEDPFDRERL